MIGIERFTEVALSFQHVEEKPHFEKTSFRIKNKIFATLDVSKLQIVIKLSEIDQSVYCDIDEKIIRPVPGSWGKKGWTLIELKGVDMELLQDCLTKSYCTVAPKKLGEMYKI